jgi:RNase P subunit RPR2
VTKTSSAVPTAVTGSATSRAAYAYSLPSSKITLIGTAIQGEYLAKKMTRTTCQHCQHTTSLRLREEFRRTAGGHTEADGKTVVCGACGDSWHFRDRVQLPEWLRQELTDRGL